MLLEYKQFILKLHEAEVPIEKRTLKNCPRYSTGKTKVPFTQWLGLKGQGSKGHDGKFYGWSHRAVHGFAVGDTIKKGMIGNKFEYTDAVQKEYWKIWDKEDSKAADKYIKGITFEPYKLKDEAEAKEHALRFAKEVA